MSVRPFIIYALPRSRTAWLSCFLTYGPWRCGHEILLDRATIADAVGYLRQDYVGVADTALILAADVVSKSIPDARVVVIHRKIDDIADSLIKAGFVGPSRDEIIEFSVLGKCMLEVMSNRPGVLSFDFDELDEAVACKSIFEHCLHMPFVRDWWDRWSRLNVQVSSQTMLRAFSANSESLLKLTAELETLEPVE